MADGNLSGLTNTEVEELWIALAPAPKHFQEKMKEASAARLVVLFELKERNYTDKMIGAMVDMTNTQVAVIKRSKKHTQGKQRRARAARDYAEEAKAAKRELALLKATQKVEWDASAHDSPI